MKTLDRYILSQLSATVLFGVVLFSIIWLAPVTMFELIQAVVFGKISLWQGFIMYCCHFPQVLGETIPIATLVGSIFVFQRFSRQFELIAIFASGISPTRLMRAALIVGVLFGAVHFVAQEVVNPLVTPQLDAYYSTFDIRDVKDRNFVFAEKNHDNQLDKFFLIGQVQRKPLSDFIVLYYQHNDPASTSISRILRAKTGHWSHETGQWVLNDGIEYVLDKDGVYLQTRHFDEQQVRTSPFADKLLQYTTTDPKGMSWLTMGHYIQLLAEGGQYQDIPYFQVRYYQKFFAPLASVLFVILGALLGMEKVRSAKSYGLIFGALVIFVYSILSPLAINMGSMGLAPPLIMAAMPLLSAIGITALVVKLR